MTINVSVDGRTGDRRTDTQTDIDGRLKTKGPGVTKTLI